MQPPLQPSPRGAQLISHLIMKMEDDAEGPSGTQGLGTQGLGASAGGNGGPPSDSEIEQVIKSAMALAGKPVASRAGTPAGRDDVGYSGHTQFSQGMQGQGMQQPHGIQGQGMQGMMQGQGMQGQREYEHYPQFLHPHGHAQIGMGPAPSMFPPKPVSLPLFKPRPHTPIMFHPAAVGVDGRVNLFVGNLPYRVRWQDLKDLFRRAGTVLRADVSLDPQSNRSRGHGTVLMGSQEDGVKAIELFNGYNWQTRILEVRPDRLPPEYEPSPYIPSSAYGPPGYVNNTGSRFALPPNGARRDSGRAFAGNPGLGVGPAPSTRFSPAGTHVSPLLHTRPAGSVRSVSPFGDADVDLTGEARFKVSPLVSHGAVSPSPFSGNHASETDRTGSPGGVDGGSPTTTRRAPPVGLGTFPSSESTGYEMSYPPFDAGHGRGFSPFGMVPQGYERASLSRSVLQGNLSSAFTPRLQQPKRPAPPTRQDTLGGRLLYVENLPPTMQWQELKDMFRASGGTVVRADIAGGGEQKGRGYGTVLFAQEGDAVAAVERFDGTDYQGRPLRVRQDKTQSGPIPALTPTERGPPLFPESVGDDTAKPSDAAPAVNNGRGTGLAGKRGNLPPLRLAPGGGYGAFSSGHSGRLMMPMEGNGMSMAGRGMAPMTPSMPGFTFHAYPSTPPLMPMGFLSPGLGPFSPALNSPQSFVFNPFMNPAPGAPIQMTPTGGAYNQHAPYAMTPGNPLTVDPSSLHHPAHPDYFPPQSPIAHGVPGASGYPGQPQGVFAVQGYAPVAEDGRGEREGGTTPGQKDVDAEQVTGSLAQLGILDATPGNGAGFSSRASFMDTRPEGLSTGLKVDRDRRASMNDAAQ